MKTWQSLACSLRAEERNGILTKSAVGFERCGVGDLLQGALSARGRPEHDVWVDVFFLLAIRRSEQAHVAARLDEEVAGEVREQELRWTGWQWALTRTARARTHAERADASTRMCARRGDRAACAPGTRRS